MREVFAALLMYMDQGQACVLVSAVGGEGSAPRKTQSHMLVDCSGHVCGTVGGGAVEGNSIAYARSLLDQKVSSLRTFELYEQAAEDIGMICGGRVYVHFRHVSPEDASVRALAQSAVHALSSGTDTWLFINLQTHTLSLYDGETLTGDQIPEGVITNRNRSAMICEEHACTYYAEQLSCSDRVYIFGGGHVAQALVPVLASVDFRCVIVEDREEFCKKELFPKAQDVLLLAESDWKNVLHITSGDCICIMTRGHKNDLACQAFALKTQAGYIGVIGSRRKVAAVNAQLRAMGFSDEQIARIITPIGLEIGAVTPAEIAVSIAAQMIAHRAKTKKEDMKKSCMG
ncbi:MAG: XdhC family protein [Clostridia bacterium]|nr:XdhC family protein [Clostridia bacterium]